MATVHVPNLHGTLPDAWFSEKIAPDGDTQDGCHVDEANALKAYLRQEIPVQEAARTITQPVEKPTTPNSDLPRLWDLLMSALMELPSDYTIPLVNLLQAIEGLPKPQMTDVEESEQPVHGTLWHQLPGFGHLYADLYQSGDWRADTVRPDELDRKRLRDAYVKRARVESHLVVANVAGITIDWGYETVADALEKSDSVLDIEIAAVAEWFRIAGPRFQEGVTTEEKSWALNRQGDLWGGGPSMTVDRWAFWKSRLDNLQSQPESVLRDAKAAKDAMNKYS